MKLAALFSTSSFYKLEACHDPFRSISVSVSKFALFLSLSSPCFPIPLFHLLSTIHPLLTLYHINLTFSSNVKGFDVFTIQTHSFTHEETKSFKRMYAFSQKQQTSNQDVRINVVSTHLPSHALPSLCVYFLG